jgi:DNA-binding transcriptional MerR regulator
MRIGELAQRVGVSTDTVRFYERSGWLPRASRHGNSYRHYDEPDVEHLRLLIELRRLDVPLDDASRIAGWCHSGHCQEATEGLPRIVSARRADVANRIAALQDLDSRLAGLEQHLVRSGRSLAVLGAGGPCCDAAGAVMGSTPGCACCTPRPLDASEPLAATVSGQEPAG